MEDMEFVPEMVSDSLENILERASQYLGESTDIFLIMMQNEQPVFIGLSEMPDEIGQVAANEMIARFFDRN